MSANLFKVFEQVLMQQSEKPLITLSDGTQYSRQWLLDSSARMANFLSQQGLEPGARVTVQIDKSAAGVCLYVACLRAGLVYHPLNTAYTKAELAYFLADAEPAAVIYSSPYKSLLEDLCHQQGIVHRWSVDADETGSLMDACGGLSKEFVTIERAPNDLAALLYSSGTTGRPKGIMLSHGNMAASAQALQQAWAFTASDSLLHMLPVFHVHGLFVALHCVLMSGAQLIFLPKFDVSLALKWLPKSTVMMGVPTYYTRLLDAALRADDCSTVRLFISGSAPLLPETFAAFEARTGQRILERYGMTETNMITSNPLDGERRSGTVGIALPGVDVRIVDDTGRPLATGHVGHILVKGGNVFQGYWRMPEKTAQDFDAEGYFDTGDNGVLSADGYLSIVGRAKDMIICGGLNVYPKEVELLIDELPGVIESAVIGVPHPDFGEVVVAVVVGTGSAETIIEALRGQLANFKLPKQVFFVAELPRNAMGKVQKVMLRAQYADVYTQKTSNV